MKLCIITGEADPGSCFQRKYFAEYTFMCFGLIRKISQQKYCSCGSSPFFYQERAAVGHGTCGITINH
jgi:hypothetical protein